MIVSGEISGDALDTADDYFSERDRRGGPAQQMVEYVQPLLDLTDGSIEAMNKAMSIGMVFWNLAVLPDEKRTGAVEEAVREIIKNDEDQEAFRELAAVMIPRHQQMFPWLHEHRRSRSSG